MKLENKIMLITYADSLGDSLSDLYYILNKYYKNAVGGVHILPFYPSSADRGFAPLCYDRVDEKFGTYEDIERIGGDYYLMFDFMINHISAQSKYFKDYLKYGNSSKYRDMFIRFDKLWGDASADIIYKRKPRAPYIEAATADGDEKIWCTFSEEQIDLDVTSDITKEFIAHTLSDMCAHGAAVIRLDAFAYAVKKSGTSCFFVEPDIWQLLSETEDIIKPYGCELLPEIHEHYTIPLRLADKGYWIYDFALPVLVLHALYNGESKYLKRWLDMCPMKQFTTLDTHDGIGIVDVKDLLPDEEIERVKDQMYSRGANVKKIYSSEAYNNLDVYQVNTTYYSALGNNDDAYLLARAIQFFAPGIPQVYYVGMLAGENDTKLLEQTKNGRDINRHYYSLDEIEHEQERPVVARLRELMELRNTHPAFSLDGILETTADGELLTMVRTAGEDSITLSANLKELTFDIIY